MKLYSQRNRENYKRVIFNKWIWVFLLVQVVNRVCAKNEIPSCLKQVELTSRHTKALVSSLFIDTLTIFLSSLLSNLFDIPVYYTIKRLPVVANTFRVIWTLFLRISSHVAISVASSLTLNSKHSSLIQGEF